MSIIPKNVNHKYLPRCRSISRWFAHYGKGFRCLLCTSLVLLFSCHHLTAQSDKKSLESKYSKLQNEIKDAEDLLNETKKKKQNSLNEVKLVNRKIAVREEMILNISQQKSAVEKEMKMMVNQITDLENDLDELKDEYAKMIYYAYINEKNYEPLHFLFASESISDAIHEIQYIKEYTSYRKQQLTTIAQGQSDLQQRIALLEGDKIEKEQLLNKEVDQKNILASEKNDKDKSIKTLQGEEKKIAEQIKKKKTDANALNKKIQNIIAEEIKKEKEKAEIAAKKKAEADAKKKADAEAKKTTTTESTTSGSTEKKVTESAAKTTEKTIVKENPNLTPEMNLVSKNFEGNKGKLPWPVERGTITERFGKTEHPVLKGVIIENNGIDIATSSGANVRALFEGEVVNVIFNPSFQKGIIIKHGDYYTVYTQLADVSVVAGQKITTKQKIGTVFTNLEEDKAEVHIEIWKGTILLDPNVWISKQ